MKQYGIIAALIVGAFLAGKYLFPPKPETKEVVKIVEVEKKVQVKDKNVRIVKTQKKDGSVVTETVIDEHSKSTVDSSVKIDSSKVVKSTAKITLGVLAIKQADDFAEATQFGATITVPVLGNIKAQVLGTTDKKVGLGLALEF